MSVNQVPITGAKSGITGTAAQLVSTSTPIQYGAQIVAAAANSGKVYVGLLGVTAGGTADATDGYELVASQSVFIPKNFCSGDASNIYVIASASTQAVYWLAS